MNSVDVTSCSHNHGTPSRRVTMSQQTERENPNSRAPQSIISTHSSGSSAFHFKWRWRCNTSRSAMPIGAPASRERPDASPLRSRCLFDGNDRALDLVGVRAEVLCQLVQHRVGYLLEAGFVDARYDLDTDRLESGGGSVLKRERLLRLLDADVAASLQDPFSLVGAEAFPELVADPDNRVVGLMLGDRQDRRDLVVLVDQIHIDRILADIDNARLQRGV